MTKPYQEDAIFTEMAQHLNVEYLYETWDQLTEPDRQMIPADLAQADLASLPKDWQTAMHRAAQVGDMTTIKTLISQLEPDHPSIAPALCQLADEFDFERPAYLTTNTTDID